LDPNEAVSLALTALDGVLSLVGHLKAQAGMTNEQLVAHADNLDLQNKEGIKALLAL
jgi:hypothetical protein